ncbi:MAG TPA: FAD-dependent monooxygenase, partial [Ilumatobacteraceae bacterium]
MSEHSSSEVLDVPVLVIGGSLVGLATSMFLAQHGVEVFSVEKHHGTAIHPRAGYFQLRTIELMRVAG